MNEPREYNLASELTDSEIANSIDLRPKVFEIIQTINGFSYLSEIRHFYSKLPRLAIDNKLSAEEVDVIGANLEKKKVGLTAQGIGHYVTEATAGGDKDTWSPSKILDKFPITERDWTEKAANDRQDKA